MMTWAEVSAIVRRILHWWWICVLAGAIAGGTAYYITEHETRYYVARTSLMVGNAIESVRPDQYQISISSTLARFYAELARRNRILQPVQERLGLPFSWEAISGQMLTTNVVASASLLEIYITDANPERAAAIANAVGAQLVSYSPTSPEKIEAEQQVIGQQLKDSQERIDQLKVKLEETTGRQQAAISASDLADINETLIALNTSLDHEQTTYSALLGFKNSSAVNSLFVFEPAVAPTAALPSKRMLTIVIASIAGLLLGLVAIFLIEQFDTRIHGKSYVKDRFRINDLGHLPAGPPMLTANEPFVEERLPALRDIQTNIMLASGGVRTVLISSPQPTDARAAFSIDLADLFARAGHKVLLIDAEFTRSLVTQMLAAQAPPFEWVVTPGEQYRDIWTYLRPTPLPNVALLPGRAESGSSTAVLIPSLRWHELVEHLRGVADVIIFDGPAALIGPDAALLAPHVDGVVLTFDPATDNREDVEKSKARLLHLGNAHLLGAVTFTPSKHWGHGRKALQGPSPSNGTTAPAHTPRQTPPKPLINLRMFGREFRIVWGTRRGRHKQEESVSPAIPHTNNHAAAAYPPPTPAAATPIVTPAPVVAAEEPISAPIPDLNIADQTTTIAAGPSITPRPRRSSRRRANS
jgi:polysaccharide biosynthesis transport protein